MLIATDLLGRGMDFKGVNTVINFDFPQSAVSYIHRIGMLCVVCRTTIHALTRPFSTGRTGRAGRTGDAITYFTEDDVMYLRTIANVMKLSGCEIPDWMLTLKKPRVSAKVRFICLPPVYRHLPTTFLLCFPTSFTEEA